MVKKGSDIKTVDDVAGKVVGAQLGTTGADYAKEKTKASSVRTYDLIDDAFNALEAGQVEAVINDCPVSKYAERAHKTSSWWRRSRPTSSTAWRFRQDSDALREAVNKELAGLMEDGDLKQISDKWFQGRPVRAAHGRKHERLRGRPRAAEPAEQG